MSSVSSVKCVPGVTAALCALLLMFAPSPPARAGEEKALTSLLLIARAELVDPNFADSVVLVLNNLGPAPAGIIVNRPTKIAVSELFPDFKHLDQLHDKVYFGGPVEVGTVWFLVRSTTLPEHAIQACRGVYLSADRDLLLHLLARAKPMQGLRIFIGHSGWGPGQLEAEIAHGDWTLEHARPDAIFGGKAEHPWPAPHGSRRST